jgi:PleD family two-component response regulator
METSRKTICIVADDMFFSSKVENTAKRLDIATVKIKNREELQEKIGEKTIDLVIIDLASRKIDAQEVFTELRSSTEHKKAFCIGYLPHVERELADKFKENGMDLVIPRSKFSREMGAIIKEHLKQQ